MKNNKDKSPDPKFNPQDNFSKEKVQQEIDSIFKDLPKDWQDFKDISVEHSLNKAFYFCDLYYRKEYKKHFHEEIKRISDIVPELKLYEIFHLSFKMYYKRYPFKSTVAFSKKVQEGISKKEFDSVDQRYVKSILKVDWYGLENFIENYYLYSCIHQALEQIAPPLYVEIKNFFKDFEGEIQNYISLSTNDLDDVSNAHSTTKEGKLLKLYKTSRLWKNIKESVLVYDNSYFSLKDKYGTEKLNKEAFLDLLEDALVSFPFIVKPFTEPDKLYSQQFEKVLLFVETKGDAREPKLLFLHSLLLILFPNRFTTVEEWENQKKESAVTSQGSLNNAIRKHFVKETEKFISQFSI